MSPSPAKKSRKSGKISTVWNFFRKPSSAGEPFVTCPKCKKSISYSGGTSNLLYHYENVHPEDFAKNNQKVRQNATISGDELDQLAEKSLAKALATSLVPFRFCNNLEFRRFVTLVQDSPKNFVMPSATKIRRVISSLSDEHNSKLTREFENLKKYTVITDGFSDLRRGFSFYSLHLSFVTSDFLRKVQFVGIHGVKGGDSVAIGEGLCELMKKFNISFSNSSAVVCDGASPLTLLADTHQLDRLHCGCHLFNLIIADFVKIREVKNVEKRVENFALHLSRNKSDKQNLKSMSESKGVFSALPLPLPATRWAGLYILLNQYLNHYESAIDLSQLQKFLIKRVELQKLEDIRDLLKPIYDVILKMEEDNAIASEVIPALRFVLNSVRKSSARLAPQLELLVEKRLDDCLKNKRLLCTMLLDIRFAYIDHWISPKIWDTVEYEIRRYVEEDVFDTIEPPSNSTSSENIQEFLNSSLSSSAVTCDKIESELLRFKVLLDSNRPTFKNPLMFWNANKNNFPRLARVAAELFGSPASSATSERLFSRCSDFLRQVKRNRTKLSTLNELLTVNELSRIEREEEAEAPDDADAEISSNESSSDSDDFLSEADDDAINEQYPLEDTMPVLQVEQSPSSSS